MSCSLERPPASTTTADAPRHVPARDCVAAAVVVRRCPGRRPVSARRALRSARRRSSPSSPAARLAGARRSCEITMVVAVWSSVSTGFARARRSRRAASVPRRSRGRCSRRSAPGRLGAASRPSSVTASPSRDGAVRPGDLVDDDPGGAAFESTSRLATAKPAPCNVRGRRVVGLSATFGTADELRPLEHVDPDRVLFRTLVPGASSARSRCPRAGADGSHGVRRPAPQRVSSATAAVLVHRARRHRHELLAESRP